MSGQRVVPATPDSEVLVLEPIDHVARRLELTDAGPLWVGRQADCDLVLVNERVSRRHATFEFRDGAWALLDHGSLHGTTINGRGIEKNQPRPVVPNDVIAFGPCGFRLALRSKAAVIPANVTASLAGGTTLADAEEGQLLMTAGCLDLLIRGSADLDAARDASDLAERAVGLVLKGTGLRRGALLRASGGVQVLGVEASRTHGSKRLDAFNVSHTLVNRAREGKIAVLTCDAASRASASMDSLGIHSAVCVPVLLDDEIESVLYADSRGIEGEGSEDAAAFCSAVARLVAHKLADLRRKEVEGRMARLASELGAAREAQRFLCAPPDGTFEGVRYASRTIPGRFVAGDFFDVFALRDGRVCFCFGDVCGQGVAAGILTPAVLTLYRTLMQRGEELADVVQEINRYLAANSRTGIFVTAFAGTISVDGGVLDYVDAGHGYWIVKPRDLPAAEARSNPRMALGIDGDRSYETTSHSLARGDRLIMYSDGIIEHRSASGDQFGDDRVIEAVSSCASPRADVDRVLSSLTAFTGRKEFEDDTSIASIEIR